MKISRILFIPIGGAAIVLVGIGLLWQMGYFKTQRSINVPSETRAEFHSRDGFTVEYPAAWTVDQSRKDFPVDFIWAPDGNAFIALQTGQDERLADPKLHDGVLKEAEAAFGQEKSYHLKSIEWKLRDTINDVDSYMAVGSYTNDGAEWLFKEIAMFNPSGTVIFLRANVRTEFTEIDGPIADKVLFSFRPTLLTRESARVKIEALPDVSAYKKTLAAAGKQATIDVEDQGDTWAIHVYEIVNETDSTSHTATFGWYTVDKKTGDVVKDL